MLIRIAGRSEDWYGVVALYRNMSNTERKYLYILNILVLVL